MLLKEWTANKIIGSSNSRQSQVEPNTIAAYLLAIYFGYIDYKNSLILFKTHYIKLLLQDAKSLFLSIKTIYLPIITLILATIMAVSL